MAKKDFTAEAADVFVAKTISATPTAPAKHTETATQKQATPVVDINKLLHPDEVKITFMLNAELNDKLRHIGIKERKKLKQIIGEALQNHVTAWERKNGIIQ